MIVGRRRLVLSWLFGVVAPPLLFWIDAAGPDVVFPSTVASAHGIRILDEDWRLPLLAGVGASAFLFSLFLAWGRHSTWGRVLLAPGLLYGTVLAAYIGIRLLPFSLVGLIMVIGVLGLVPFATAWYFFVEWRTCVKESPSRTLVAGSSILVAGLLSGLTFGARAYVEFQRQGHLEKVASFPGIEGPVRNEGDRVLIGSSAGAALVDLANGKVLTSAVWPDPAGRHAIVVEETSLRRVRLDGCRGGPIVQGDRIVHLTAQGTLRVVEGSDSWEHPLETGPLEEYASLPMAVSGDRVVVVGSDIQVVDLRSRAEIARRAIPSLAAYSGHPMMHVGEDVLVLERVDGVMALDLHDLSTLWDLSGRPWIVSALDEGRVALLGESIELRDSRTGKVLSSAPVKAPFGSFGGYARLAPAFWNDRVLLVQSLNFSDRIPVALVEVFFDGRVNVLRHKIDDAITFKGPGGERYVAECSRGQTIVSRATDDPPTLKRFLSRLTPGR